MRIQRGFLILLGVVLLFDRQGLFFYILLAVLVHEAAHAAILHAVGGKIEGVRLGLFGITINIAPRPIISYGQEILAIFAGPAVNLLLAFVFSWHSNASGAGVMLLFGLFNLLPVKSLDGGRIVHLFFLRFLGLRTANLSIDIVSVLCLAALAWLLWLPGFFVMYGFLLLSFLRERPFTG